jgi:hypothetical protein
MHALANVFAKRGEIFPKIDLAAQFVHCGVPFADYFYA